MRYNDIFIVNILLILFIGGLITFIKSSLNLVFTVNVDKSDIFVKLNVKYLLNLINIKTNIYPKLKKKIEIYKNKKENIEKEVNRKINKKDIKKEDIKKIYSLIKRIKIYEIYSDIGFGNENVVFTSFIHLFINTIYGNLINLNNAEKIYLRVNPNFTKNYVDSNIKIHIKLKIKDIIIISVALFKIYKKVKKNRKDGGNGEINRSNSKSYGDNI